MFEGTFKIDRAIREIEEWAVDPRDDESARLAYTNVLELLREIRETDAEN